MKEAYRLFNAALDALYSEYSDYSEFSEGFADALARETSVLTRRAGWLVWSEGGFRPELLQRAEVRALMRATFECLSNAVEIGLKGGSQSTQSIQSIQSIPSTPSTPTTPTTLAERPGISYEVDPALASALERNAFIFSGFKTYHLLREMGLSLTQDDGSIKPYEDFEQSVLALDQKYNRNYLRAEYNHAIASSQMAERWQRFEEAGDRYDLQYRTAGDERVREEHAALDGITLPPSDPFWASYFPPNGWNCRCTAVQVRKDKYPRSNPQEAMQRGDACTAQPKQRIFRYNPGKNMKVFPPKHPYLPKGCQGCQWRATLAAPGYAGVSPATPQGAHPSLLTLGYDPGRDMCRGCGYIRAEAKKVISEKEFAKYDKDPNYVDVKYDEQTGTLTARHRGHKTHPNDRKTYFSEQLTGDQLEDTFGEKAFKSSISIIWRDESKKKDGNTLTALDMDLNNKTMDLACIAENKEYYGWVLYKKNGQLIRYNRRTDVHVPAEATCLYFHDPEMYSRSKIHKSIESLKRNAREIQLKQIYCAVNRGETLQLDIYDI